MKNRILTHGLILLWMSSAAIATAEGTGWKMPNLNPFGSKTTTAGPPTSGWKMPNLWPKKSTFVPKRKSSQPSTLSKMTSGTKSFFSKTADAINPWDDKPAPAPPKITGSNSIFTQQRQAAQKKEASSGVLPASWFGEKKDSQPKSVNDFLSQPRP